MRNRPLALPAVSAGLVMVAALVTAGPDGAMWFTTDRGQIGRITTP